MAEVINVNLEGLSILDKIQELGLAQKVDILNAIAIKNIGKKHIELFNIKIKQDVDVFGDNIKPSLPNSRMLIMFQLTFASTEPEISWGKIRDGESTFGKVLSSITGTKVTGSDYQFDEPVTKGTEYNIQADQDCTFDYVLIVEYTIGL